MQWFCRFHKGTVPGLLLLVMVILLLNLFLFPRFYPDPDTTAAPLDLMFGASGDDAFYALEAYGEEGRRSYLAGLLLLDFIYPLVYTLLFVWLICLASGKVRLALPALLPPVADYLENIGIAVLLVRYPERLYRLAAFVTASATVKWLLLGALLVYTAGLPVVRVLRSRA
jgi:hypothetical protein